MRVIVIANIELNILIGLLCVSGNSIYALSSDLPCAFYDSINLTNGVIQSNRSIVLNDFEFPDNQYATVNYTLENGVERIPVAPYTRGCVCNRKPCIRLCCPYGTIQVKSHSRQCQPHEAAKNLNLFETDNYFNQSNLDKVQFNEFFAFVDGYPCKRLYVYDDEYIITTQGQIALNDILLTQRKYCIGLRLFNESDIDLKLLVCSDENMQNDQNARFTILPICMLFSVFFIILTLIIYGCIPKLQNLNGKCLICFLAALAIGYSLLSGVQLNGSNYVQPLLCNSLGYLIYLTMLSAFLWLSVINFDLWLSFQTLSRFKRLSEERQFFWYTIYSCGVPCLLTIIIITLDQIESIPDRLRPRVGTSGCFLHKTFIPQFLFFYLPVGVIITLNVILFILTALSFHQLRQQANAMRQSQDDGSQSQKTLNRQIDGFRVLLYLRLFVIAGVGWILEIISFLIATDSIVFLFSDIWNCLQGVLIFILLILRRRMFRLIKERWNGLSDATNPFDIATASSFSPNYFRMSSLSDAE